MRPIKMLLTLALTIPSLLFAQLRFSTTTSFADALAQAKTGNKLVFIDVYTEWCGPCKRMDQEVFPLPLVGNLYNTGFINLKIDAEKGGGIDIAKKYQVNTYPTYLFINGDGTLIHRAGGSMPADDFLREGKAAIAEAKQPYTVLQMENDYPSRKTDKTFMFTYLSRLTALRLSKDGLLDEYISMLSPAEQADPRNIKLTVDNASWLNRKLSFGAAYDNLLRHFAVVDSLVAQKVIDENTTGSIKSNVAETSLAKAIRTKDLALMNKVQAVSSTPQEDPFNNRQTVALQYYQGIGDVPQYKKQALEYVEKILLAIPVDSLDKWDLEVFNTQKAYFEKKNGPKADAEEIYSYRRTQSIRLTNTLTAICEYLLTQEYTPADLVNCRKWTSTILATAQKDPVYFKHTLPHYHRLHATVLYRSGEKKAAIDELEKLLTATTNPGSREPVAALLAKMKNGKM